MNSLASIVNEIKLVAEGSNDHGTAVQYAAWYYGFHPLVDWVLTESVRAPLRPVTLKRACKTMLLNRNEDIHTNFWKAYARIQLGLLETAGSAERQHFFDWAKRNADDGVIKERPLDRRYILRQIRWQELDQTTMAEDDWLMQLPVANEMIEAGDFDRWGVYLHEHWQAKQRLSSKVSFGAVDAIYREVRERFHVLGGKVIGAGGGGFLMLYCYRNHAALERYMAEQGMPRLHYAIEPEGTKVIAQWGSGALMESFANVRGGAA